MSRDIEEKSLFTKFSDLMDQNTKGVQIGCYSVAFIGLTFALRRVRPFSRFKKPSQVPNHFIKEKRELLGTVVRVEPNSILLINHKPLIYIPGIRGGELPTKIANVEVNGHGISWLQTLVAGTEVKFVPILKTDNYVECQITFQQKKPYDKKEKTVDLGVSLLSINFGTLKDMPINKSDTNYKYYTQLMSAKETALRKKMGAIYYVKPTKLMLASIISQVIASYKLTVKLINLLVQRISKKSDLQKAITAA